MDDAGAVACSDGGRREREGAEVEAGGTMTRGRGCDHSDFDGSGHRRLSSDLL